MDNTEHIERLLAVFAHPDDESFGCAGIFAAVTERGGRVTLVCATRGEAGEISPSTSATPETLADVREAELRTAMGHVGVADVRFLDYRDSGMAGTAENDNPLAFVNAPEADVVARLRAIIDEVRPHVVVTFGPDGMYGHPDHLMAHRTTTAAVLGQPGDRWRPGWFYYHSVPRERMQELARQAGGAFADMTDEMLASFGTPRAEITTEVEVSPFLDRKWDAIMAHQTQMGEGGPLSHMPREVVLDGLRIEHFTLVSLPWAEPAGDPLGALTGRNDAA